MDRYTDTDASTTAETMRPRVRPATLAERQAGEAAEAAKEASEADSGYKTDFLDRCGDSRQDTY